MLIILHGLNSRVDLIFQEHNLEQCYLILYRDIYAQYPWTMVGHSHFMFLVPQLQFGTYSGGFQLTMDLTFILESAKRKGATSKPLQIEREHKSRLTEVQLQFVRKRVTYLFHLTESVVNTMGGDFHFTSILGHLNCSRWTWLGFLCDFIGVANIHENSTQIRFTVGSYWQRHFIYKIIHFDWHHL